MRTFSEFCENKPLEIKMQEVALLMSKLEIEPFGWILEWAQSYPELEMVLLEDISETYNALAATPTFLEATPATNPQQQYQAPTFGAMARQVGQAIGNYFTGPQRRYSVALRSLGWLKQKIDSLPNAQELKTSKGDNTLSDWLGKILSELQSQAQQIPGLIQNYSQQAAAAATPAQPNQPSQPPNATSSGGGVVNPTATQTQATAIPMGNAAMGGQQFAMT